MTDIVRVYVRRSPDGWRATIHYTRDGISWGVCSALTETRERAEYWKTGALIALWDDDPDRIDGYRWEHTAAADESFGYWAGPLHEADGAGNPGAVPLVRRGQIVHGIDDDWSTVWAYTRRPIAGEW